jgi:putative acetyltransferase
MTIDIVPLQAKHFPQMREVLDVVAREGRYLAFLQAPSQEVAFAFYKGILDGDWPHFVAMDDGRVVGWCDILPTHGEARSHVGTLGIGVLHGFRGRGLGEALMKAAIAKAWAKGFTRIELTVRADNPRAVKLYERMGFETEGRQRNAFCVRGEYFDAFSMARLREHN